MKHTYEGAGAPATTPAARNLHYVDTDTGDAYVSAGTSSAADWKRLQAQLSGADSPEGVLAATVGTSYLQVDVGVWWKNTGTGNTGWILIPFPP